MQKLTLRMDANLVDSAKKYAALHGKSLSQLVADYFDELTQEPANSTRLPPLTQSLKGILNDKDKNKENNPDESYKKHLEDKYL